MINHQKVRANLEAYRQAIIDKGLPLDLDNWLAVADEHDRHKRDVEALRRERNRITEAVALLGRAKHADADLEERLRLIEQGRNVSTELAALEEQMRVVAAQLRELDALMPGLPRAEVPLGRTDEENVEIRKGVFGIPNHEFARDHLELMELHGMVDMAVRDMAGSRAYALTGMGALLELAILRLAFDLVLARGFTPVLPPLLVKHQAMFGSGYFPLGEDNAYQLEEDGLYLTGTSEVGMVAMMAGRLIERARLPMRFVGMTPCFRREAGSAGRDVRGLYRVHQFQKVEQVVLAPDDPELLRPEYDALLKNAEDVLTALELPYRVVAVCRGEMGLGQVLKHDIETWMPSRGAWGETHSCSLFDDFQGRRLNIRYQDEAGARPFVCTLNNTAVASPRILIPFLEIHQRKGGAIFVPEALRPYLGGRKELVPGCSLI